MTVNDIREYFIQELHNERFITDRLGEKTIEFIGASFIANEPAIFGTPNEDYIARELDWYESQSLNVYDIYGTEREPPLAWLYAADENGIINSNYGKLIFSNEFNNQFEHAIGELINNPDSRRACMVYNRPSIWEEYNSNGKSDFICTNAVTYYIRNNKLHTVVQMRSNDVVYGYRNDYAWQKYVQKKMCDKINLLINDITYTFGTILLPGHIYWQVQNFHVYSKHFHLVK